MFDVMERKNESDGVDVWDGPEFDAWVAELTAEAEAGAVAAVQPDRYLSPMDDLETLPGGSDLAVVLESIDVDAVSGFDRVVVLQARARMAARLQAQLYGDMVAVTDYMREVNRNESDAFDSASAEIQAALTLTRRTADTELAMALDLVERLPNVRERFVHGAIDRRKARCIIHATSHLDRDTARAVADRILDEAPELTTGQIAHRIRRMCLDHNPNDAEERYNRARDERRVTVEQNPTGTGNLYAMDLPADRLAAIADRIHTLAKNLKRHGETRTMDQLRTDVLLDLLEGTGMSCGHTRGSIDLHIDLATLARLRNTPGEIPGFGPVIADIARQIAATSHDAEWRWTLTDDTGSVIANGITTRRPTAAMRRYIEARRRVCVFPGCRMPATKSDIDHTIPWTQSKRTHPRHLAPLCRYHHRIRHLPHWSYQTNDADTITWTTPTGHTHQRRGPPNL